MTSPGNGQGALDPGSPPDEEPPPKPEEKPVESFREKALRRAEEAEKLQGALDALWARALA